MAVELAPVPDAMKNRGAGLAQPEGLGVPSTETASRTLLTPDNGASLICATNITFTVPTGRSSGFGVSAYGAGVVSFAGMANAKYPNAGAPVITDMRTSGAANPACVLVQVASVLGGAAADAYNIYGTKT